MRNLLNDLCKNIVDIYLPQSLMPCGQGVGVYDNVVDKEGPEVL